MTFLLTKTTRFSPKHEIVVSLRAAASPPHNFAYNASTVSCQGQIPSNLGGFSHSLTFIRVFRRKFSAFKHLWQQQFCFAIGETGGMKGFQQISQHHPWSKTPETAQKTLDLAGKVGAVREPPPTATARTSLRASYRAEPQRL
jgi:hypothetical protein